MKKHLDLKIFGRVQGVFFRHTAKQKSEELGLSGFARNEPDGSVYIEAEGEEEKLNEFLKWCRIGSDYANVEKVKFEFFDGLKNFNGFEII